MKLTINYRQTACRLLAALFFFLLLAPMAAGQDVSTPPTYWENQIGNVEKIVNDKGGTGTSWNDAILIASAEELAYFAQQVNKGEDINLASGGPIKPGGNRSDIGGFFGYYFALSANINLEKHYWTPIGTEDKPFKAYFDGRGHCVSGLKVKVKVKANENVYEKSDPAYAGLFGNAYNGTIQNLGVRLAEEGVQATAENGFVFAGGIAGQARIIYCCYVEGLGSIEAVSSKIDGSTNSGSYAGGIVGNLLYYPILTHCYATVAVKAVSDSKSNAGGIAGMASGNTPLDNYKLSYTYATGAVEATGTSQNNYAGGICGYAQSLTIGNNLALNDFIKGNEKWSNRIVGKMMESVTSNSNYASPEIVVNGKTVSDNQVNKENGANTLLSSFEADLKKEPAGNANGWATSWTFTSGNLPQLNGLNSTPLKANLYLPSRLYIVSPTGGTLTVTDDAGNPLADGSAVLSGTQLKLANTEEANYYFSEYLSGSDKGSLNSYGSNSITMPDADLYLSATFTLYPKLHIVSSTGGTLEVMDKDGNKLSDGSNILPGTVLTLANTEEANYYFSEYLSGSDKGSLNSYDSNSITMTDDDLYLSATFTLYPKLHIVSSTGGTLTVTDKDGKELPDGSYIRPGTVLTLANTEDANYYFSEYLSGSDKGSLKSYDSNSITMTDDDLYLSATFTLYPKLHIVSSTGGTLEVMDKDGNKLPDGSNILPGTVLTLANTEEANYRFSEYLSGSDKGSLKSYDSNSITMTDDDLYLSATFTLYPKLHIVSSTGGTLEVTDKDGNKLPDGSNILPGTVLTLANTEEANYYFSEYLSGSDKGSLNSYDSNSITMTDDDLYLSATFTLYPKLHIVSSTGGTLTVTDKDGKELPDGSYIRPGTVLTLANTEDANYYFSEYLSGSDKSSLKSYGSNSITMPDADLYLSATFTYQEPEPPYVPPTPVYYSVYLPQVEGATTDPGSGKYEVESRDSFRFYLKIDSAYSESQPVVTTDRGETLKPCSSDGAYLVNDVCSDVEVFIDGIFKNPPPVANEAISADALVPQIWSEGSMLCIRMPEALPSAPVRIFTVDGRLYASFDSTPGLNRRQLPTGIYIVRVGDTACKVIVK